jgi:hypothetical protein
MRMDAVRALRGIPEDVADALVADRLSAFGCERRPNGFDPRIQVRGIDIVARRRARDGPLPVPQEMERVFGVPHEHGIRIGRCLLGVCSEDQHDQLAEERRVAGQSPVEVFEPLWVALEDPIAG